MRTEYSAVFTSSSLMRMLCFANMIAYSRARYMRATCITPSWQEKLSAAGGARVTATSFSPSVQISISFYYVDYLF